MPGPTILDAGLDFFARCAVGLDTIGQVAFRLWDGVTSLPLLTSFVLSDFNAVTWPAYIDWTTSPSDWTGAAGLYQAGPHNFVFGSSIGPSVTVLGYVVYDPVSGVAFFAEEFPLPFNIPLGGGVMPFMGSWLFTR